MTTRYSKFSSLTGLWGAALGALLIAGAPNATAFWGDNATLPDGPHSSFHYEFTRTLARAAGFSRDEAELISVVAQATDRLTFQGTGLDSPMVQMWGTERILEPDYFYHWPRRNAEDANGVAYPGNGDTCRYFDGSSSRGGFFGRFSRFGSFGPLTGNNDPCPDGISEIAKLEDWAIYGGPEPSVEGAPAVHAPLIVINLVGPSTVQGRSLPALGIFLHALADSYSHEACMKSQSQRGHRNITSIRQECSVVRWHEDEEFGPTRRNSGTRYTINAGMAMWQALNNFRQENPSSGTAQWSDSQAKSFVTSWATKDRVGDRLSIANSAYDDLN